MTDKVCIKPVGQPSCLFCCSGILWNLSSKDNLKEKLAKETLPELTEKILVPLCGTADGDSIQHTASEADIFYNTTGCLRYTHTGAHAHTHKAKIGFEIHLKEYHRLSYSLYSLYGVRLWYFILKSCI